MIAEIEKKRLQEALDLVNRVFSEFVAIEYSEEGRKTFNDYLINKYDEVEADLLSGNKKMWGYFKNDNIVGVIAIRNTSHISLMFVDKKYHKKGIAKELFRTVVEEIKSHADVRAITVNSSPYALEVYERLGFVKTDEKQEKDGIIYIPMKYSF